MIGSHEDTTQSLSLAAAARDAWLYGLPLIECAAARATALKKNGRVNAIGHRLERYTPQTERVTASNNDLLMSWAWLDLSAGPVALQVPASEGRYFSVALLDMYTNNFAVLGPSASAGGARTFKIVAPGEPDGENVIHSPTPWVWALVRTLVDDDADMPAAQAVQRGFTFTGSESRVPLAEFADRRSDWREYFSSVRDLMRENPPPGDDSPFLATLASAGFDLAKFDPLSFAQADIEAIEEGVKEAKAWLKAPSIHGSLVNGWFYPPPHLGKFGQDYPYRALVALVGLAALPPEEAIYLSAISPNFTREFDSALDWQLEFPGDQLPPVDAFWSLTLYRKTAEGQFFMQENPIGRYSIGDRTPGLVRDERGGFTIYLTRSDPGGERSANWLPTPPDAAFVLTLRCYRPCSEVIDGRYSLPRVTQLEARADRGVQDGPVT